MRARIVRLGNSQGVRIPKPLLERSELENEVEIEAEDNQIVIRPARRPREGWEDSFRQMARSGDAQLLDAELLEQSSFDRHQWES